MAKRPLCLSIDKEIRGVLFELEPLGKRLRTFRLGIRLQNDMAFLVFLFTELLNIFFLSEAISATRAYFLLQGKQQKIERVFRFFGLVDVICSVSKLREELPYYSLPDGCTEDESKTS